MLKHHERAAQLSEWRYDDRWLRRLDDCGKRRLARAFVAALVVRVNATLIGEKASRRRRRGSQDIDIHHWWHEARARRPRAHSQRGTRVKGAERAAHGLLD